MSAVGPTFRVWQLPERVFRSGSAGLVVFALACLALFPRLAAQDASTLPPSTGLHYYVVVDVAKQTVIQRGKVNANGAAFSDLIFAADTTYRMWVLHAATLRIADVTFTTPDNGGTFGLPNFRLRDDYSHDTDGDGLSDIAEFIVGTDPNKPDTNGDGISDGAEVRQGLDPLSGLAVATGAVAAASSLGTAIDICTLNDIAALAESGNGVAVFNIFNGMSPVLIAQVQTHGTATAVAAAGNLIAVADGPPGLAIVDISDPPAAKLVNEVSLSGYAQSVATVGTVAYTGTRSGQIYSVDLITGLILDHANTGASVDDVAVEGNTLYAVLPTELRAYDISQGVLSLVGRVGLSSINAELLIGRRRLFVGGGYAMAACAPGYDSVDVHDPTAIKLLAPAKGIGPNSFKQIVANGSGLGLAAVGVTPRPDGTHNVSLFDVSNPGSTTNFITTFPTPQIAYAVAIYNGIGYVATGVNGLTVVNYLAYDNKKVPPTIALRASFPLSPAQAAEGSQAWIAASVSDDVQVRNVEFYINGAKVETDGNFPFEYHFVTPTRANSGSSFRVRARASDTGGNATWTDEYDVTLVPDTTPPRVRNPQPGVASIQGSVNTIIAYFTKPIDPTTLGTNSFSVVAAGPDGRFGTADDIRVTGGIISYRSTINAAVLTLPSQLATGFYQVTLGAGVADLAGDKLGTAYRWSFWALGAQDSDHDGVPDNVEILLGLDPLNPDSKGDGVLDGDRDFDQDGLSNAAEIIMGTDPRNPHSVDPKILDGDLDRDGDALSDSKEFHYGTNPFVADTDGDGWNDESEVTAGSDPLDPLSKPPIWQFSQPPVSIGLPSFIAAGGALSGVTVAGPPVSIGLSAYTPGVSQGVTVALPPVSIGLPAYTLGLQQGVTVAQPPVSIGLPSFQAGATEGVTVAQPPVTVQISPN